LNQIIIFIQHFHPVCRYDIIPEFYPVKKKKKKQGKFCKLLTLNFEFEFWCLTPLSAIFQLYHGDQF